jgi:RNA polymerase sigma factor for flagellar operon FliA
VVVQRLVLDYFDRLWGKRRPSAAARRLGPIAVRIERLRRDGISSDEACAILRAKLAPQASLGQLEAIAAQVSDRPLRRFDGEQRLATLLALNASPEQRLGDRERDRALARVLAALNRAVAQLPPEDRAMIKLRGRLKIAAIARFLGQPEKPMYRRLEKLLRTVRRTMEREGVSVEEVEEALA